MTLFLIIIIMSSNRLFLFVGILYTKFENNANLMTHLQCDICIWESNNLKRGSRDL